MSGAGRRSPVPWVLSSAAIACWSRSAHASFLHGEALDAVADVLAIVVIVIVPITVIVLFWLVHVLPEKIAHRRGHPQLEAIRMLCLLSLVFGGLFWPLAWLWAYSKPVFHKLAYGTDKSAHDEHTPSSDVPTPALTGEIAEVAELRANVDRLLAADGASKELWVIREQLAALEPRLRAKAEELH
ncbi:MAG TPA: DUF3302 domain-containing protein [Gammaproteobacteria bacterium]|nr:DUF3302 domain-containing protein [Gammaproteobacteria bacterium]